MHDYKANVEAVIQSGLVQRNFVYQLDEEPELFDVFNEFYQFCCDRLAELRAEHAIDCPFIFNFKETVNAAAGRNKAGQYLMMFNKGLLNVLVPLFENAPQVFQNERQLKHYLQMKHYNGHSLASFMVRIVTVHVFFHEQAHLLQFKHGGAFLFSERFDPPTTANYDPIKHACEIDADWAATRRMYSIMRTEFLAQSESYQTENNFFKIICVGIATVLLYFYRTHDEFQGVYYFEGTHPHHSIRIGFILHNFLFWLQHDPTMKFKYSLPSIRSQVHRICKFVSGLDPEQMATYADIHAEGMNQYMNKQSEIAARSPFLLSEIFLKQVNASA